MKPMESGASPSPGIGGDASLRFSHLSAPRQTLVRLCQAINVGAIEGLKVENGEPVFDPPPMVLKDVKLDSDEGPRPELGLGDFVLSDEVIRLMSRLVEIGCGTLRRVEVRAGIPRRVILESHVLGSVEASAASMRRLK